MNCNHEFVQHGHDNGVGWCSNCGALRHEPDDEPMLPLIAQPGWAATYRAISAVWLGLPDADCGQVDQKFCELLDVLWDRLNSEDRAVVQHLSCDGSDTPIDAVEPVVEKTKGGV